eukprot:7422453-Heterocapsa_arctica.AAC.1
MPDPRAEPEASQEAGPICRYRVTNKNHPYLHTMRHPVPPTPDREQPAPRATVDPRGESQPEAPQEDDADDIDPDADVVIDAD